MTQKITIEIDEISRAKRAVVVLMNVCKDAYAHVGKEPPLELRKDVLALMGLIRKIEKL